MNDDDYELVTCRECDTQFNLGGQWYYDNLCPSCKVEKNPEATWVGCIVCGEKIPPDEMATKQFPPTGPHQQTETLPVHRECK